MADKLSATLDSLILSLEDKLFLREENELGLKYAQADLSLVLSHVRSRFQGLTAIARADIINKISAMINPLYKITFVCQYKSVKKLNYADYANMDSVKDILFLYTVETSITQEAIVACNIIADVISDIDTTRQHYRNSLSYKFLRAFLLVVIIGDYVSASCIAMFILTQLGE